MKRLPLLAALLALALAPAAGQTQTAGTAPALGPNTARVHYFRPDGQYGPWGLHVWEDTAETVTWTSPLAQTGRDAYGVYWDVRLKPEAKKLGFIVHQGDTKDPGPDQFLDLTKGKEAYVVSGNPAVFLQPPDTSRAQVGSLERSQAHWLSRDTLAVKPELVRPGARLALHYNLRAGLRLEPDGVKGGSAIALAPGGALPPALAARFPHLRSYAAVKLGAADLPKVAGLLRSQLAVSSTGADGKLVDATGVQTAGVLDDLYAYAGPLGPTFQNGVPTLRLWAPTARAVRLQLFESDLAQFPAKTYAMKREGGVWRASPGAAWAGKYYLYEVQVYAPATRKLETNEVTDPYSVGLSLNSRKSRLLDLSSAATKPSGWDTLRKPALASLADLSLYELQVRDFSASDASVPAARRGTYLAFAETGSSGMRHLTALAKAGLKAVHLLPTFDIATIDERGALPSVDDEALAKLPPNGEGQQAAVEAIKDQDAYNWGYDPYHYTVPEGSYAVDAEQRTLEYRRMVQALNGAGLRVVQDVVYNHTSASGQAEKSVLDRVVPGYYHRLNLDGAVETSTCCQNTASEHRMMEKLMVDSVLTWARAYKVDGFRFDLMGHHMVANMKAVRAALDGLTLSRDGVDGRRIYLYGEGWNFGEVADNRRGPNATQRNVFGLGIGTFNDRLRDAVRGGGPFDADPRQNQGFATGLYSLPNAQGGNPEASRAKLLLAMDQIRVGLAGNLRDYALTDRTGRSVKGSEVDYNGSPTGYAASPLETINYVSAHDNETLFDIVQLKAPAGAGMADRVRMHNLALSIVALSQGIPFFHAGDDLLRSKSLDRDSYNSGDWFNRVDWSGRTSNWGVGLPPKGPNGEKWPILAPLLANAKLKPAPTDIARARDHLREMLAVRSSSRLFRLGTAAAVGRGLEFLNAGAGQVPGLIVMSLAGTPSAESPYNRIIVAFNATGQARSFEDDGLKGLNLRLHPALGASSDPVVRRASYADGRLTVPALTTAVFVQGR